MTSPSTFPPLLDVTAQTPGLDLRPFRGLRYDPAVVPDLAAATSPPYDVVDADGVRRLEQLDPHNVVRLILPREDSCGSEGRYAHAAATLRQWVRDGVLVQDEPGFYVYEEAGEGLLHRGVVGAVALDGSRTGAVLPHEEVMPQPVADRTALMRATGAHLEPILLVHDGDPEAGERIDALIDAVVATPQLLDVRTAEDHRLRLWHLPAGSTNSSTNSSTDGIAEALRAAFARRRALIADGHHRWAAYHALAAELGDGNAAGAAGGADARRVEGGANGGWESGLALLVDASRYPLALGAIHRLVHGLTLTDALAALAGLDGAVRVTRLTPDSLPAPERLAAAGREHPVFDLVAADGAARLEVIAPGLLAADQPAVWEGLDAALLHAGLLPRWQAEDGSARHPVTYCHDARAAVTAAREGVGLAVLLNPVTVPQVLSVAAAGATMPRKSTSFGPKPRTGLVLRAVTDPAGP
ncbi:MAG TPA: DUF1015 domain-containing protein [Motilibacteraceae bacterium]|nr:DUF1015 domain-containing protein [Motilibacteraceae bacterium]